MAKLKSLIPESVFDDDNGKLTTEDKRQFLKIVGGYNKIGKTVHRESNLREVGKLILKMAEAAESIAVNEAGDWFDGQTVKRNMSELKKLAVGFNKIASEAQTIQERMSGLYEDMGNILGRYFEIKGSEEDRYDKGSIPHYNDDEQGESRNAPVQVNEAKFAADKVKKMLAKDKWLNHEYAKAKGNEQAKLKSVFNDFINGSKDMEAKYNKIK